MSLLYAIAGMSGIVSTIGTVAIIVSIFASLKGNFRLALQASWVILFAAPFCILVSLLGFMYGRGDVLGLLVWGLNGYLSYRTIRQSGWTWRGFRMRMARKAGGSAKKHEKSEKPYWRN